MSAPPRVEPCAHCGAQAKVKRTPSKACWCALLIHKESCIWLTWIGEGTQVILERGFEAWNTRSRASVAALPPNRAMAQLLEAALLHPESAEGNIRQVIEALSAAAPKYRKCRICGHDGCSDFEGNCSVLVESRETETGWRKCGCKCEFAEPATAADIERETLLYWLLRCYQSGHREGWEPGPNTDETMDGLLSVLANRSYDPKDDAAKELLKQPARY